MRKYFYGLLQAVPEHAPAAVTATVRSPRAQAADEEAEKSRLAALHKQFEYVCAILKNLIIFSLLCLFFCYIYEAI